MSRVFESNPEFNADLFDFQVNGFGGIDFQRDDVTLEELRHATAILRRHGAGSFFLTLITDDVPALCRKFERYERFRAASPECRQAIVGYHLEGPWLSPEDGYRGAHPRAPMHAPEMAEYQRLQAAAGGAIRLVTIAPEWPGAPEFIAALTQAGVNVALGHTNASDAEIDRAIQAGARFCTHLGNGTPLVLPRHNNIIQRLLARDELIACFIPDGQHIPPRTLRNFVRAKPPGRFLFTTDAMGAAGAGPGKYTLGALRVEVGSDAIARQPGNGGFAGSVLTPADGVRRTAEYLQLPITEAARLWSEAGRRAFGVIAPCAVPRSAKGEGVEAEP